jgi:voltage-gated potassium channel
MNKYLKITEMMRKKFDTRDNSGWRKKLYRIIFYTDTLWGKTFDVVLLIIIILSIIAVMLESVVEISTQYGNQLRIIEWLFTFLFTLEYLLRIVTFPKPLKYIFSFLGIIDFLAITPTFFGIFFKGSQALIVIRSIRLIRIFRIFKLARYLSEASMILKALKHSTPKITVFLVGVISMTIILGTLMYLFEGSHQGGFTSIPKSVYWAIVTLTTVGYGDITPQTFMGQVISSLIMILGYGIIAVPTGIVSGEFIQVSRTKKESRPQACSVCGEKEHDSDANYCKKCGTEIKGS